MTAFVFGSLFVLALIDGACSGFRAGLGRTGLIRHGDLDRRSALLGVRLVVICLIPAGFVFTVDSLAGTNTGARYLVAGKAMLAVLVPYATVVGLALIAYGLLGWRQKYIAMAVVLGPFTLARPAIALGAAIAGAASGPSLPVVLWAMLATLGVLAIEPIANRKYGNTI